MRASTHAFTYLIMRGAPRTGCQIKKSRCPYQLVEIMACPSGCLNGGGQIKEQGQAAASVKEKGKAVARVSEVFHERRVRPAESSFLVRRVYRSVGMSRLDEDLAGWLGTASEEGKWCGMCSQRDSHGWCLGAGGQAAVPHAVPHGAQA